MGVHMLLLLNNQTISSYLLLYTYLKLGNYTIGVVYALFLVVTIFSRYLLRYSDFTDEEVQTQRLSNLFKITQRGKWGSRI